MSLGRFVVRRVALMVPTFLGITALTFAIAHFAPGDPLQLESELATARLQASKPSLVVEYGRWLSNLSRFDFGRSLADHRETKEKIFEALPNTLVLSGVALVLAWLVAIPLGTVLAVHAQATSARFVSAALSIASGVPSFWVAVLLLLVFANPKVLDWLPFQGVGTFAHGVLPVICLTYPTLAFATRQVRASMREALAQQFVLAARARGVSEARVLWQHAFRNALLPLVTVVGLQLPHLISGSAVVERVFGIPGMGSLAIESVGLRDYPVVMAIATLSALATMVAMLLVDLAYLAIDPRLRAPA
jgi:peptide/nickel transport system permease protein